MSVVTEKSVISFKENQENLKEDIENLLKSFATAYGSIVDVKSHTEPIQKKINNFNFLSGYSSKDSEEEIGAKLSENIEEIIKSIGPEFEKIIENNFDIVSYKTFNLNKRANLEADEDTKAGEAEILLIAPDKLIFDYRSAIEIDKEIKKIKENNVLSQVIIDEGNVEKINEAKKELKLLITRSEKEISNEIKAKYNLLYVNAHDEYTNSTGIKNLAIQAIRLIKRDKERITILDTILTAYIDGRIQIVSKIKAAVEKLPMIINCLSSTVTVRATSEDIIDPFRNNNLTGISECLFEKYRKKTFVTFTNSLIDVMSFSMTLDQTENSPWSAFEEMESILANWKKKELFGFMTEDQFFSAVFLKGMHPDSKFRKEIIHEATKFIRTSMESEDLFGEEKQMPIFKFIKRHMKIEQENRKFAHYSKDKVTEKVKRPYDPQWNKRKESNTENAAVAFSANNANNTASINSKLFAREVFKSEKVSFEDNRAKKHTYAATLKPSSLCDKCYPDSGVITNGCSRKCYGEKCTLCGYYGHISYYCMQAVHAVTGNKVQH